MFVFGYSRVDVQYQVRAGLGLRTDSCTSVLCRRGLDDYYAYDEIVVKRQVVLSLGKGRIGGSRVLSGEHVS